MMKSHEKWALIVDDDAAVRSMIREYVIAIEGVDIGVVESEDGYDALQKILRQPFDLLITDLAMPRMRGERLVETLSSIPREVRPSHVLVVSAHLNEGAMKQGQAGITFFPKPFDPDKLKQYLKAAFSAPKPQAAPAHKIDVNFINPFIDAALKVIETTCSTKAEKELVFVRKKDQVSGDISAVIAMNSSKFTGSMAIAFDEKCFLGLVKRMLGTEYTEINAEIQDAAGELCNQIFGLAKTQLNATGHDIRSAIPSIVCGKAHTIKHLVPGVCIAVVFKTDIGYFTVEAAI